MGTARRLGQGGAGRGRAVARHSAPSAPPLAQPNFLWTPDAQPRLLERRHAAATRLSSAAPGALREPGTWSSRRAGPEGMQQPQGPRLPGSAAKRER